MVMLSFQSFYLGLCGKQAVSFRSVDYYYLFHPVKKFNAGPLYGACYAAKMYITGLQASDHKKDSVRPPSPQKCLCATVGQMLLVRYYLSIASRPQNC